MSMAMTFPFPSSSAAAAKELLPLLQPKHLRHVRLQQQLFLDSLHFSLSVVFTAEISSSSAIHTTFLNTVVVFSV